MKKEFIRLVGMMALTVLLAVILVACGGGGESGGSAGSPTSTGGSSGSGTTAPVMGTITGDVKDASTRETLSGVSVKVYMGESQVGKGTTNEFGIFMLTVPATQDAEKELTESSYRVEFSKNGYLKTICDDVDVFVDETTFLETILMTAEGASLTGDVSGTIYHAVTGAGVSGLTMKFREGINVKTGTVVTKTATGSAGSYSCKNLKAGSYTAEVSGDGYITMYFTVTCEGGESIPNQNATISPILGATETRIVLTWRNDLDLDAHLTGPIPGRTDRFHVYWWSREFKYKGTVYSKLDKDDQDGLGPETATIYKQTDGLYSFCVFDNSTDPKGTTRPLSNSGARVDVYQYDTLVRTFNIPPNGRGIQWRVFEIYGTSITPLNLFTDSTDPAGI